MDLRTKTLVEINTLVEVLNKVCILNKSYKDLKETSRSLSIQCSTSEHWIATTTKRRLNEAWRFSLETPLTWLYKHTQKEYKNTDIPRGAEGWQY